jgi:5'(3')-deoxyribonucleotidase
METDHNIAFDVDGVLAGFQSAVIRKARQMGLDFYDHYSQWDAWEVHTKYDEEFGQIISEIDQSYEFWFEGMDPLPEAHIPYDVEAYVSARRGVPTGLTENWLKWHDFPEAPVHITDSGEEKVGVLRDKTDADVFVDDKVSTIEALQEHCTRENDVPYPILFNQPHNSTYSREETHRVWTRAYYLPEVPRVATMRIDAPKV